MRVCPQRNTKCTSETKVGELEVSLSVDEQILRFEIAVEDAVSVEEVHALDELPGEGLHAYELC